MFHCSFFLPTPASSPTWVWEAFKFMEGKDTLWRKAHFFTCQNLLMTSSDLARLRQAERAKMFIAKSYGGPFSCQLWLPVSRGSCLGLFLPVFSDLTMWSLLFLSSFNFFACPTFLKLKKCTHNWCAILDVDQIFYRGQQSGCKNLRL